MCYAHQSLVLVRVLPGQSDHPCALLAPTVPSHRRSSLLHVLLVESDPPTARAIACYLEQMCYCRVKCADTAQEALALARDSLDIILLNVMLLDGDGIDLCARLRQWHRCPIIFISQLADTETIVRALQAGGDDYVTMPFDIKVLAAKIAASIRRTRINSGDLSTNELSTPDFSLNVAAHEVAFRDGRRQTLSQTEFLILRFLMQHPGTFFNSHELYRCLWDADSNNDARTVQVHIHNLRSKIEPDPAAPVYLCNEWGKGYIFHPRGTQEH